jgi:hypothetical protein
METQSKLTGHVLGKTYRSAYWQENYTVQAVHDNGDVTVFWHNQKRTSRHSTPLDRKDRMIGA